jgi:two-component system OmpR family response regulator
MISSDSSFGTPSLFEKPPSEQAKRILVVDDDRDIRQMFSELLGRTGYHVDAVGDGADGWKAVSTAKKEAASYALLITDNTMPKVSGFELIMKIRAESIDLTVIMATMAVPENSEKLKLSAVLIKPFTPEEMLKTVEKVLCEA